MVLRILALAALLAASAAHAQFIPERGRLLMAAKFADLEQVVEMAWWTTSAAATSARR